ncbi:MAG: glycosyltransferase family 2 protein [Microscillaceae bacterium]|nr:glycosyltransferase family 2 protein [Microscillaceae bacterium]
MNISVCMATYNGEKFIQKQLDSILIQLTENDEIIISDDSSGDNTVKIIESYQDSRIKLFKNNTFRSPAFNFENALRHVSKELIFLSDQDDVWKPNKVQTMKEFLRTYSLIVSDCEVIDTEGNIIFDSFFEYRKSKKGFLKNIIKNSYIGCCMAFRSDLLPKILPIPPSNPKHAHDWWIGLIAEIYGNTYFHQEKLIAYVRHDSTATQTTKASTHSFYDKFNMRWIMMRNLTLRISKLY